MSIIQRIIPLAAVLAAAPALAAGPADSESVAVPKSEPMAGLEGHYQGTLLSIDGKTKTEAELTIDPYRCFVISAKSDHGMETGFVEKKGDELHFTHPDGKAYRIFKIADGAIEMTEMNGKPAPEGCCVMKKR